MAQVVGPIARYVGNVAVRPHRDLVVLATHMATALLLVLPIQVHTRLMRRKRRRSLKKQPQLLLELRY